MVSQTTTETACRSDRQTPACSAHPRPRTVPTGCRGVSLSSRTFGTRTNSTTVHARPLWLSCEGHQKGPGPRWSQSAVLVSSSRGSALDIAACGSHARMKEKPSLMLEWSKTRSLRDALRVEAGKSWQCEASAFSVHGVCHRVPAPDHLRSSVDERF